MNEQLEIRDTRNGEWLWVYNSVIADPHLSLADKAVYAAIASFGGFQKISPTVEEIANRCKVSERQVRDSLGNLIEKDYLKTEKGVGRGNASIYWLLKRPKGCRYCTFSVKGADNAVKGADNAPPTYKDKKDISDSSNQPSSLDIEDKDISYVTEDEVPKKPNQNKAYEAALAYMAKKRSEITKEPFVFAGSKTAHYAALKAINKLMSNKRAYEIWEELCESEFWQEKGFNLWTIKSQFLKKGK